MGNEELQELALRYFNGPNWNEIEIVREGQGSCRAYSIEGKLVAFSAQLKFHAEAWSYTVLKLTIMGAPDESIDALPKMQLRGFGEYARAVINPDCGVITVQGEGRQLTLAVKNPVYTRKPIQDGKSFFVVEYTTNLRGTPSATRPLIEYIAISRQESNHATSGGVSKSEVKIQTESPLLKRFKKK
jgi:hypothetical protein